MKHKRSNLFRLGTALLIGFGYIGHSHAQEGAHENVESGAILALAKVAGACGIMDEMIDFQEKTKLEGGDNFVTRFWHAESARRGMTVQEVSDQCDRAIAAYDRLWRAAVEPKP